LYFQQIKNLAIILVEMLLIYAIYAFATNVVASGKFTGCSTTDTTKCTANFSYIAISLGSKQMSTSEENKNFYYIQCWIGIAMVVVWFLTFALLKYYEKLKELEVDLETRSASDFALVVEGLPDNVSSEEFQAQLSRYEERIQNIRTIPAKKKVPLKIARFNKGNAFQLSESELKDEEL
jgi:hypothetical protein